MKVKQCALLQSSLQKERFDDMTVIKGTSASPGIVSGRSVVLKKIKKQNKALGLESAVLQAIEEMKFLEKKAESLTEEAPGVFEAYRMLLEDDMFISPIKEEISAGKSPCDAVKTVSDKMAQKLFESKSEYLRQRSEDIRFVGKILCDVIDGKEKFELPSGKDRVILMAKELTPVDTVSLDTDRIGGIVTMRGGTTSHVAILAKSMGIPAVVNAERIEESEFVFLDGTDGIVYINPDSKTKSELEEKRILEDKQKIEATEQKMLPAVTKGGKKITLCINIGSPSDIENIDCSWVDGIGLFRTEFMFASKESEPDIACQTDAYRKVLEKFSEKSVTIRVLDAGGDKPLAYLGINKEDNPFLGLRGIRLCLKNPEIFKNQIKAILMASGETGVRILLPMITNISELKKSKELISDVCTELETQKIKHCPNPKIGVMIETPAAAEISDILATEADFFSVGTNDLIQYLTAADRGNSDVSEVYDQFHPAVERVLKRIVVNASKAGISVSICGDLASDPVFVPKLLEMGYEHLSVPYPVAADIKQIIRNCQ